MNRMHGSAVVVGVCLLIVPWPGVAGADALRCQRTISSAAARFDNIKARILQKCKEDAVKKGFPPSPTDCPLPPQDEKISAAEQKMRDKIAKDCGGDNKVCNAADVGANADIPLADIGWAVGACPDLGVEGCVNAIADCNDIATCLICVGGEAVSQPLELSYDLMTAAEFATRSDVNKCQVAIGKAPAKVLRTDVTQLARCWDGVLKGKEGFTVPPGCPATATKALANMAKAEAKQIDTICAACGAGGDENLDGVCDLPGQAIPPAAIGFETDCPDKTVPGSGELCARVITTLDDLIACIDCVGAFEVACATDLAVPTQVSYPAECTP